MMKNTSKETTRVLIIAGSLRIGGAEKVAADIGFMQIRRNTPFITSSLAAKRVPMSRS